MKTIHKVISLIGVMLLGVSNIEAALVANPSFETFTGSVLPDGGVQFFPSTTALTDWSVIGGEIALITTPNIYDLTASDENNFLDLAGYTNGGFPKGVSQTLTALTVGQSYVFSMDLGISNDNSACPNCGGPIGVEVGIGNMNQIFVHNSSEPGNIWMTYEFEFIADNINMPLTIVGNSAPGNYIGLDNISVSAVPLPSAVWLFISGIAILFHFGQRRLV